jgi:GNAT superfamily N-acetyltransferase
MVGAGTPQCRFRRATAADALCIGALGIQVFLDTYAPAGIRASLANEALQTLAPEVVAREIADPACLFIVAEAQGHVLGFAKLTIGATHALVRFPTPAELNRLYVQAPIIGRGLGRALLTEAERIAAAAGASALWLTAWVGNARALAFYARQGYAEAGSTPFSFQGETYENRLFVRALAAGPG